MAIYHHNGSEQGRQLCDALLRAVEGFFPGVVRMSGEHPCSFHVPPNGNFAYVYHVKNDAHLNIFFRALPNLESVTVPSTLNLKVRDKKGSTWARRFPASIQLTSYAQLATAAELFARVSVPLTAKKGSALPSKAPIKLPEEISSNAVFTEGSATRIAVNRYERDPKARNKSISYYGARCFVCAFDFSVTYGDFMDGYIHVHHLTPLSTIAATYQIDPINDLRPVCANCHAAIHYREPPYSIQELRDLMRGRNGQSS
jgi:hypothetical protein